MTAVLGVEPADGAFKARISRAFNAGFAAGRTAHPGCTAAARAEAAQVAARGQVLARALAAPGR